MLDGLISGLIVAWILVQFKVDDICIRVLQPFVQCTLTTDHFYFALGFIGLIGLVYLLLIFLITYLHK